MPPLVPSVRWNAADEESANCTIGPHEHVRSKGNNKHQLQRRGSRRSIDPAAAIPIEYRSLWVPVIPFGPYWR